MASWLADVHAAIRGWRCTPIAAVTIVLTLALGLASATALIAE